jgi:hypothetical protein
LKKALEIDDSDLIARKALITLILDGVSFATHHIDDSVFLGDEVQVVKALDVVRHQLSKLPDDPYRMTLGSCYANQNQLVNSWIEYQAKPEGTFPDWCLKRRRKCQWSGISYYGTW